MLICSRRIDVRAALLRGPARSWYGAACEFEALRDSLYVFASGAFLVTVRDDCAIVQLKRDDTMTRADGCTNIEACGASFVSRYLRRSHVVLHSDASPVFRKTEIDRARHGSFYDSFARCFLCSHDTVSHSQGCSRTFRCLDRYAARRVKGAGRIALTGGAACVMLCSKRVSPRSRSSLSSCPRKE